MPITVSLCAATSLIMIASVLFFPRIKLGKFGVSTYWVVTVVGAAILLCSGLADAEITFHALIANTAVNPLKILVLFLSMTLLSVFLDELGLFRFLASVALKRAGGGQTRLFFLLYITVSVLTVFTSNDVIILSFTPFVCYFAKNAKIDPVPYLAAEFVAANTWSMALVIGNPTNIYLATAYGIDFLTYLKYSLVPTLFAGSAALICLFLLFRKRLSSPVEGEPEAVLLKDKLLLWVGIAHLAVCTVLLAVGSYFGAESWLVALCSVVSLFLVTTVISLVRKRPPRELKSSLKRAPYSLIPFVLSMFVMIVALEQCGATDAIANFFGASYPVLKYGVASFFASNLVNNIPLSVLFSAVLAGSEAGLPAVLATVIGSNLGAFFTPIGALAGMMFTGILARHGVKFGYLDFLKLGATVALPALAAALGGLLLVL